MDLIDCFYADFGCFPQFTGVMVSIRIKDIFCLLKSTSIETGYLDISERSIQLPRGRDSIPKSDFWGYIK